MIYRLLFILQSLELVEGYFHCIEISWRSLKFPCSHLLFPIFFLIFLVLFPLFFLQNAISSSLPFEV